MAETLQSGARAGQSVAHACLSPLLNALNWEGEARYLCEALPDGQIIPDLNGLLQVLNNLNFRTTRFMAGVERLTEDVLPALLDTQDGDIWVIVEREPTGLFKVFKGREAKLASVQPHRIRGTVWLIRRGESGSHEIEDSRYGLIGAIAAREKRLVRLLFGSSLLVNALALALPVYMLSVYDLAIGAGSMSTLVTLAGAMAIMLAAEVALRELRARSIASFAVKAHMSIMEAVVERVTRLPYALVANASLTGQMNRFRAFEASREVFSGPLAVSLLDLPFIPIFIVAVFIIGGWLGWLMVAFIAMLLLLAAIYIPRERIIARREALARSETRMFRKDMISNLSVIRGCGAEEIWEDRYAKLIAAQSGSAAEARNLSRTWLTLAYAVSSTVAALVIGFGALGVMAGEFSVGALAAVMAIVWRVLSPIQSVMANLTRLFQALDMARQLNNLMRLPAESSRISLPAHQKFAGRIDIENVGYRGALQGHPILRSVSMTVEQGEIAVLAGPPGPSRSALLRLIGGLSRPDTGRILIDGFDARQFDVRLLRQRIALVADDQIVVPGSLAYNFWLAAPLADDAAIKDAIRYADLEAFVATLRDGLQTDLGGLVRNGLDPAVLQRIRLARAYLQDPAVYLFDEPVRDLDATGRRAFINRLLDLKGDATIVIRTSDEDIMRLADKVAHFEAGQLARLETGHHDSGAPSTKHLRSLLQQSREGTAAQSRPA